jgi:hypothetical protein
VAPGELKKKKKVRCGDALKDCEFEASLGNTVSQRTKIIMIMITVIVIATTIIM